VFDHVHNITLEIIVDEFNERMTTTDPDVFASFDDYENAEITLSHLGAR
jgi:hypothetical protein